VTEVLPDIEDIVNFILSICPSPKKIVEVGVGRLPDVALKIRERVPDVEIVVVDADASVIDELKRRTTGIKVLRDDILRPKMEIYRDASLIYSIRPPPDMLPHLKRVSLEVHAPLVIRPLSSDISEFVVDKELKVVRHGKAILLLYIPK